MDDRIDRLAPNEIFVFGSNASGAHGGGAARTAYEKFGAVWGQGHGLQGQSYGIDTMSGLDVIADEVATFLEFARSRSDLTFLVTEIGCGIAGYTPEQVAPLFAGSAAAGSAAAVSAAAVSAAAVSAAAVPSNVRLPSRFRDILSPSSDQGE